MDFFRDHIVTYKPINQNFVTIKIITEMLKSHLLFKFFKNSAFRLIKLSLESILLPLY